MKNHKKTDLELITCPFPVEIKDINWNEVGSVISFEHKSSTVIVKMKNDEIFIINIPKILYDIINEYIQEDIYQQDLDE